MRHLLYSFSFLVFIVLFSGCASAVNVIKASYYNEKATNYYMNKQYRQAFELYKKAAENKDASAYFSLYTMYKDGLGIKRNEKMANEMLNEAARLKYPAAQTIIASRLIFTSKKYRNEDRALYLLKQAASKEYKPAYILLHNIYKYGLGSIKKDEYKANQYDRLLRAQGFEDDGSYSLKESSKSSYYKKSAYSNQQREMTFTVQRKLKKMGFYKGKVDGITGPRTRLSIKNFQKSYNLPINTNISKKLIRDIEEVE